MAAFTNTLPDEPLACKKNIPLTCLGAAADPMRGCGHLAGRHTRGAGKIHTIGGVQVMLDKYRITIKQEKTYRCCPCLKQGIPYYSR